MRREFIVIALGFLCVWTLWSFLQGFMHININVDKVLIDTVVGVVTAGNFSYWQLGHSGPLLIELTSLTGDADLYVSDKTRPSYEMNGHNFSSATCGHDIVEIPTDFPRPIGIGVFGYWSHGVSEYSIQVFLDAEAFLSEHKTTLEESITMEDIEERQQEAVNQHARDKSTSRKSDEEKKPHFLKLLSMLDMVFEMFIL